MNKLYDKYLIRLENYLEQQLNIRVRWPKHISHGEYKEVWGLSLGGKIQVWRGLPEYQKLITLLHEYYHEVVHRRQSVKAHKVVLELEANTFACTAMHLLGFNIEQVQRDINFSYYLAVPGVAGQEMNPKIAMRMIHQHMERFFLHLAPIFHYTNKTSNEVMETRGFLPLVAKEILSKSETITERV